MPGLNSAISAARRSSLFLTEFFLDFCTYARYCSISPWQDWRRKAYYKLIIETHSLEKGMSLDSPRMLFARTKIPPIIRDVRRYGIGSSDLPVLMAVGALQSYLAMHRAADVSDPLLDSIDAFLTERAKASSVPGNGGLRTFPNGSPMPDAVPSSLLTTRFSSRVFSPEPLPLETVQQAVRLAQTAPSQCNRQATQVHFYTERAKIAELLTLQSGAGGFTNSVTGLAVIAFDLVAWGGAQQRNQGYVDASLFAMNLMLAIHALGGVSCPLNLAISHATERKIRAAGNIPVDQRLVMMIAIGQPGDGPVKAAASPRRPLDEVLHVDGAAATRSAPPSD